MLSFIAFTLLLWCILCFLLSFRYPLLILGIAWGNFAVEQVLQAYFNIFAQYSWLWNIVVALMAVVVVAYHFGFTVFRGLFSSNAMVIFYMLIAYSLASVNWAPDPEKSWERVWKEFTPWIPCILVPLLFTKKQSMTSFYVSMVSIGILVAAGSLSGDFGARGITIIYEQVKKQANPLALASFVSYVALLSFLLLLDKNVVRWQSGILLLCGCISLFVTVRTGSRGQAYSSLLVGFLAALLAAKRFNFKLKFFPLALGCVGVIYFFLKAVEISTETGGFGKRFSVESLESAILERQSMVGNLFDIYIESSNIVKLFGLGNSASFTLIGGYPHMTLVEVLCEEGVIGLLLYVTFILKTFQNVFRLLFKCELEHSHWILALIVSSLFLHEFINSFKQGCVLGTATLVSFAFCLATLELTWRKAWEVTQFNSQRLANTMPLRFHQFPN
jgi:hypothetical protein